MSRAMAKPSPAPAGPDEHGPQADATPRTHGRAAAPGAGLLQERLHALARELGFEGGVYVHLGHAALAREQIAGVRPLRFVASSICDRRLYLEADPWTFAPSAASDRTRGPVLWTSTPEPDLAEGKRLWRESLRGRGIRAGVLVPVHDGAAGPAYLNLYSRYPSEAERRVREDGPLLAFAASRFHDQAKALSAAVHAANRGPSLTAREMDCLRLAALGLTAQESAAALRVALRTVEFHLKNAVDKFGAPNKVRAVALAVSQGLIEP